MSMYEIFIFVVCSLLDLRGLILYVSEGFLSVLLCVHIVGMGTFGLYELILCVSEGFLS